FGGRLKLRRARLSTYLRSEFELHLRRASDGLESGPWKLVGREGCWILYAWSPTELEAEEVSAILLPPGRWAAEVHHRDGTVWQQATLEVREKGELELLLDL